MNTTEKTKQTTKKKEKTLKGVVVKDKMDKTIVVSVSRFIKHPLYGKFYKLDKKYKVHNAENKYKIGDIVEITETSPISKDKRHKVVNVKGGQSIII